ncbi:MAG: tetratricopeptide repeat protein, partial [Bacteroidota bacterium]|nr:tetratricopeptide repeat protein [Bacteroidota bacterium]
QFDVCQRCHLQGTAVLHKNHTWVDFKPGHKLSDFMDIYLPKYENDESFIMASHADRLKQSACFKGSDISCLSCHNPHKSVHTLPSNYFDDKCMNCHSVCNDENNTSSCVSCHMPKSSSTDIPHVTITDHKIGIHSVATTEKGKFLGLIAINNEQPTYISKAKAYLKQYERFAQNPIYLDSAKFYLDKNKDHKNIAHLFIKYYYLKEDFTSLVNYSMQISDFQIPKEELGLTFARIGESCLVLDMSSKALQYYNLAHKHSSSNLTYQIKIGVIHIDNNQLDSAQIIFENVLLQYSKNKEALLNLGYVFILQKQYEEAKKMLEYLIQIEPDYLLAYENMVLLYLRQNNSVVAKSYLNKILEIEPNYKIQSNIINSFIIN